MDKLKAKRALVNPIDDAMDAETKKIIEKLPSETWSRTNVVSPKVLKEAIKKAETPTIKDSGARTEFETGAVRDIQEGKGRCDLMPLDVMALLMDNAPLSHINRFQKEGTYNNLYMALRTCELFENYETMMLEVAIHFEEGAKKYGENNWQKGIPVSRYIDSAVRHYLKHLRGDRDEPHDRAFCWNIMCAIWTCKHKPELNNYLKLEDVLDE